MEADKKTWSLRPSPSQDKKKQKTKKTNQDKGHIPTFAQERRLSRDEHLIMTPSPNSGTVTPILESVVNFH